MYIAGTITLWLIRSAAISSSAARALNARIITTHAARQQHGQELRYEAGDVGNRYRQQRAVAGS